ncbi:MAG: hypothetical protein GXO91_02060 [FCB group bacterium]|nr:hypothetical protein [FCB group bacterium]
MWSSLESIVKPKTIAEALEFRQTAGARFLAGGSYLVSEQDPMVTTLIDLNGLLETDVREEAAALVFGAGLTLQSLVEFQWDTPGVILAEAARYSVSSKNIRNQRTLGGEIARMRTDSELCVLFHALRGVLHITGKAGSIKTSLEDWDGNGILTHIEISRKTLEHSALERYALLPSAPAFMIVCGAKSTHGFNFCTGGRARNYWTETCAEKAFKGEAIRNFSEAASEQFESDRYGTRAYKKMLLKIAFDRLREKL